jgi:protein-arginine kinase activator protein McsA
MFGNRKNFNDILREFDNMFSQFDSSQLGEWKSETRVSEDGTIKVTSFYRSSEPKTPKGSNGLKRQLELAIENEDFEKAVEIRDQIRKMETNQESISKLEEELKQSIKDHNFERSIEIRDELKKLKL